VLHGMTVGPGRRCTRVSNAAVQSKSQCCCCPWRRRECSGPSPAHPACPPPLPAPPVQIRGYPTLKVYHGGKAVDAYRGGRDLESLKTYAQVGWGVRCEREAHAIKRGTLALPPVVLRLWRWLFCGCCGAIATRCCFVGSQRSLTGLVVLCWLHCRTRPSSCWTRPRHEGHSSIPGRTEPMVLVVR